MTTDKPDGPQIMEDVLANLSPHARAFSAHIASESDRGAALVVGAVLDELIGLAIRKRFVVADKYVASLFEPDRALGSFSAKIRIGYALGIYGPGAMRDLDRMRKVRNHCAHRLFSDGSPSGREAMWSFDIPEVTKLCRLLETVKRMGEFASKDDPIGGGILAAISPHLRPKWLFVFTAMMYVAFFEGFNKEQVMWKVAWEDLKGRPHPMFAF